MLLVRLPCAQYHLELERVIKSDKIQKRLKEHEKLFNDLSANTGKSIKNFDDVQDLYSTLRAEEAFNLTLPDWTKNFYPHKMLPPTIFSFILNSYNDRLIRLKGGVFLKKLISDWRSKINGEINPRKAFLYGGHDATIVNLMTALNVWDPQMPEYGIMIILEFSKDRITKNYGLEIFLRNSTSLPPFQLTIPGCEKFCGLEKLVQLRSAVIPEDWEEECKTDDPEYEPPPPGGP